MAEKTLDFLVIGAGKSATTTLFEWAKHHPQIYMPEVKEAPFYDDEEVYKKGLDWYLNAYFAQAPENQITGTITPQYMLGRKGTTPEVIAQRIKQDFPDIKLVTVLRDPIERSFSHHKMALRRGNTHNSFDEDVKTLLDRDLSPDRANITPQNNFLIASEYGRILSGFYDVFDPSQLLVLFTEELQADPQSALKEFFAFIGVNNEFVPANIETSYHKGGGRPKTKILTAHFLFRVPFIEKLWKNLIPHPLRKKVENKINRWNVKPSTETATSYTEETENKLIEHFREDIQLLEKLSKTTTPWERW